MPSRDKYNPTIMYFSCSLRADVWQNDSALTLSSVVYTALSSRMKGPKSTSLLQLFSEMSGFMMDQVERP